MSVKLTITQHYIIVKFTHNEYCNTKSGVQTSSGVGSSPNQASFELPTIPSYVNRTNLGELLAGTINY